MDKKRILASVIVFLILAVLVYLQYRHWRSFDWSTFLRQTHRINKMHVLHGIALVYGSSGTTRLNLMTSGDLFQSTLFTLGLSLILIGLCFKVAAAPFQIWTPDVYEGAPTPVTALFSAGPKAATFALLIEEPVPVRVVVPVPAWVSEPVPVIVPA